MTNIKGLGPMKKWLKRTISLVLLVGIIAFVMKPLGLSLTIYPPNNVMCNFHHGYASDFGILTHGYSYKSLLDKVEKDPLASGGLSFTSIQTFLEPTDNHVGFYPNLHPRGISFQKAVLRI